MQRRKERILDRVDPIPRPVGHGRVRARSDVGTWQQLMGYVQRRANRTVTMWIESGDTLGHAVELARELVRQYPRLDVVFVQAASLTRDHGFDVFTTPSWLGAGVMLSRLRTHTLVIGGPSSSRVCRLLEIAARRGTFVALLTGADDAAFRSGVDLALDPKAVPSADAAARLGPLLRSSRRKRLQARGQVPLSVRVLRLGRGRLRPLWSLKFHEYGSIGELREALGAPGTLLCLGNGPSSVHPGLSDIAYNRLFRVNHSWSARGGAFDSPDLVFTGQRDTVMRLRPHYGFVFGKIESEEKILSQLFGMWRRLSFATAQRLGIYATGPNGSAAPTNGALMIATAVALRPQRLVVGGVDLFSDPAGAYPGDAVTENAYALGHEASFDRAFILDALRRYTGELVVFGGPLRTALQAEGISLHGGA
jgi:hypothetical protein